MFECCSYWLVEIYDGLCICDLWAGNLLLADGFSLGWCLLV